MDLPRCFFKGAILICSVAVYISPALNQPCWTFCYMLEKAGRDVIYSALFSESGEVQDAGFID